MGTKKQIKVKYSPLFKEQIEELQKIIKEKDSKFHRQLLTAIEREKGDLSTNPHHGIQIKKNQIPKKYITEYGVINLWKINLPDFWRRVYTITGNEIEIISILLDFMGHKKYNKIFGYKKR
ncbi:MAG: type II toxin-antitoxin system RelE/ParE family toxin [Nanoarchaeota archaeon]|nr:type II toxin-antitoxin system RelE/ParE family toxin [Nanoarchaeota archaeon]